MVAEPAWTNGQLGRIAATADWALTVHAHSLEDRGSLSCADFMLYFPGRYQLPELHSLGTRLMQCWKTTLH